MDAMLSGVSVSRQGRRVAFGPYMLDCAQRMLWKNHLPVRLGNRAMNILIALVGTAGHVFCAQPLTKHAWPHKAVTKENSRIHLAVTRTTLASRDLRPRCVIDVDRGHSFVAPVRPVDARESDSERQAHDRGDLSDETWGSEAYDGIRVRGQPCDAKLHTALRRAKREGRIEERKRLARELHDTLLQSAHGLILMLQGVASQLATDDPKRKVMESALDQACALHNEARNCVSDLRSSDSSPDIGHAIRQIAQSFLSENSVAFRLEVSGSPRHLQMVVAREIIGIAREALANAFKHAFATAILALITYDEDAFRVQITDNGRGIASLALTGIKQNHFGLRGMSERAENIAAQLSMWSREERGTVVQCTVPASAAYVGQEADARVELRIGVAGEEPAAVNSDSGC
jgi:signal transduction histidine kinase